MFEEVGEDEEDERAEITYKHKGRKQFPLKNVFLLTFKALVFFREIVTRILGQIVCVKG